MKLWKVLETQTLFKNQWFDVKKEKVQVSETIAVEGVITLQFRDWVNIIALNSKNDVILEHQYRHGIGAVTVETPSGSQESFDATIEAAAVRELHEETGYVSRKFIYLGKSQALPQLMNNYVHHFLALDCTLVDQPKKELGGSIDFWLEPFSKAIERIEKNEIMQSYVVEGLLRAKMYLERNKT
jgi:8-oxo-dGTP pyrophosphatase MutT (NUDIX family)